MRARWGSRWARHQHQRKLYRVTVSVRGDRNKGIETRTDNFREWCGAKLLCLLRGHQDESRRAIVQTRRVRSSDCTTVGLERGTKRGDLLVDDTLVLLVLAHDGIALLALDRHRRDLRVERARLPRPLSTTVRLDGVRVLRFAGDGVLVRGGLATVAHREFVVDVPQTVGLERVSRFKLAEDGILTGKKEARDEISQDGKYTSGRRIASDTYGALLILSIPPAATTLLYPEEMLCAASMMDFIPLAQTLLIVVASEEVLMPAPNAT